MLYPLLDELTTDQEREELFTLLKSPPASAEGLNKVKRQEAVNL